MSLTSPREELRLALSNLLENIEPPPAPNCSCHLTPPCGDCVDHAALRDAIAEANRVLEDTKGVLEQPPAPFLPPTAGPSVTVTRDGICFGRNCWFSHEKITGRSAAELNTPTQSIALNAYRDFVAAALAVPQPLPAGTVDSQASLREAIKEHAAGLRDAAVGLLEAAEKL